MNRYPATLIQDTSDFFLLAGSAIATIVQAHPNDILSPPCFYSWMFAEQIERVFGLVCVDHRRRSHPNDRFLSMIRNLCDLDQITKQTLVVPSIYGEQELKVWLWQGDLIIQYYRELDRAITTFFTGFYESVQPDPPAFRRPF